MTPTSISIGLLVSALVWYCEVPLSLVFLTITISQLITAAVGGYYLYKNPMVIPTAYKIFMNDLGDILTKLTSKKDMVEHTSNKVKVITTPTGTHFVSLDGLNFIPHTITVDSVTTYTMAENCSYSVSATDLGCTSLTVNCGGVMVEVKDDQVLNLEMIQSAVLNRD